MDKKDQMNKQRARGVKLENFNEYFWKYIKCFIL